MSYVSAITLEGGARRAGGVMVNTNYFTSSEHLAYNPALKEKARTLRNDSTLSEVLLWNELNQDQLGVDFHRQKPIGEYIVDFFCPELMLVIEMVSPTDLMGQKRETG